jgi:hypothetical protein
MSCYFVSDKYCVEWKLATPNTWDVSKIKNTLEHFTCLVTDIRGRIYKSIAGGIILKKEETFFF